LAIPFIFALLRRDDDDHHHHHHYHHHHRRRRAGDYDYCKSAKRNGIKRLYSRGMVRGRGRGV
jgi:hypothetical protein